jgi:ribosomal protein S18 acetylase RimI-like enzyme
MSNTSTKLEASTIRISHAATSVELQACFPVISHLRSYLVDPEDWVSRAEAMASAGYRVLAVWHNEEVVAVAGYRIMQNLIHHRFLYIDDLVTSPDNRGKGLGAMLLTELTAIGTQETCTRLVLDTAAANTNAQRFYKREGLLDLVVGFIKPL